MDEEFLNADEDDFETEELDDEEVDEESDDVEAKPRSKRAKVTAERDDQDDVLEAESDQPPPPPADHVVRVYEYGALKRTIEREFTAEEAEAFASEYNRTARAYGRFAVAAKAKSRAKKLVPWPTYHGPTQKA